MNKRRNCTFDQTVNAGVKVQIAEGTVEMRLARRERVQQWTTEQIVVLLQDMSVETVRLVSHERVQRRTADRPRPQMAEETVKMVGLAPGERVLVSASGRQLNLGSTVDHRFFLLACSLMSQVPAQLDVLRL